MFSTNFSIWENSDVVEVGGLLINVNKHEKKIKTKIINVN